MKNRTKLIISLLAWFICFWGWLIGLNTIGNEFMVDWNAVWFIGGLISLLYIPFGISWILSEVKD